MKPTLHGATDHVPGEPITAYCDARRLGLARRLALFEAACDAVRRDRAAGRPDLSASAIRVTEAGIALTRRAQAPAHEPAAGGAADAHALGAVLYELLAGDGPRTSAPTRPSMVAGRAPVGLASAGRLPRARIRRRLSGDLDAIALKALAPEPERRYASVDELLDDVRRHRAGLRVLARTDSLAYRVEKFVHRHRAATLAAALATAALLAGLGAGVAVL